MSTAVPGTVPLTVTRELTNTDPALRSAWHPVALCDEITTEPTQVWLLGEPWVVVRATPGAAPIALVDRCPHRLAPLSAGRVLADGTLQCGYHGWRFGADGGCTLIPALGAGATLPPRARVQAAAGVAEVAGMVWLAPEEPRTVLPDVSLVDDSFVLGQLSPVSTPGSAGAMLDNFLDVAHFPFVHAGTFATDESDQVDEYDITRTDEGFIAVTEHSFANHEDPGVAAGFRPLVQRRRMTYTYTGPFTATLRLDYVDAGGTNLIVFAIQPERDGHCRVYTSIYRDDIAPEDMPGAVAFEERVLAEDLVIQHRMPPSLPLDLTAEVHIKADKVTIELRRVLAAFVDSAR
ncbi:MAG: Rieske (2Fe-2S) iron-sulfur domain protein [Ilumatobacteraceae bacterium]|nr:Rieske (2Fe-2S) iron-sulfur domain protein [Ilumatobacteraceae bacterium]